MQLFDGKYNVTREQSRAIKAMTRVEHGELLSKVYTQGVEDGIKQMVAAKVAAEKRKEANDDDSR